MKETVDNLSTLRHAVIYSKILQNQHETSVLRREHTNEDDNEISTKSTRNDELFEVPNPHIHRQCEAGQSEYLYHLDMLASVEQSPSLFHDVQFVCVGDTPARMYKFAGYCMELLKISAPVGLGVADLCGAHARFVLYKVGPVLIASHGVGNSNMSILLNELFKLLHYGKAKKAIRFLRIGISTGVGVRPGTTVITQHVYNASMQSFYEQHILGHAVFRPAVLDQNMVQDLLFHASSVNIHFPVIVGNTLCTSGYFEEQARLDGAFCDYSHLEKVKHLQNCQQTHSIRNMDMESLSFAALTHFVNISAASISVVIQNGMIDEPLFEAPNASDVEEWESRPQRLAGEYIRYELRKKLDQQLTKLEIPKYTNAVKKTTLREKNIPEKPFSSDLSRLQIMKQELDKLAHKIHLKSK
ncbi:uridine phosphorylase 1-like isoform X2 [Paramacrobiotus metropolitanus]|nr:uridine phosphorylase 1-like isoform X2 [Paramacrobiotus metropolitanus]